MADTTKLEIGAPEKPDALMEICDDGHPGGRNPSKVALKDLKAAGFSKTPILRVLRAKCIDCCGGILSEVRACPITNCELWPYRMAKNPFSNKKGNAASFGNLKKTLRSQQ